MSVTELSAGFLVSEKMQVGNGDFQLDDWVIRTQRGCIERADESRRIKPKAMQVLEVLAKARGEVVSRTELFDSVWPGQSVTDDVLTNCVVELRKAFNDSPKDPKVIETIPKKGFRIVSDVRPHETEAPATRKSVFPLRTGVMSAAFLLVVIAASLGIGRMNEAPETPIDRPASVAVLPFIDLSPDGDQEYFADGLSEELINRLTQIQGLQVTGRTSSFYFKGRNEDLRDIGEQLSVTHVIEGSVRKSNDELRITAQLIDVDSGFHLWSDTYDRRFQDIFAVQEDIAESVATALSIRLSVGDPGNLKGGTDNVAAFDAAMLGNSAHHKLTAASTLEAIEHFEQATELDPDFALGWERLANAYRTAWLSLGDDNVDLWARLADQAISRAIDIAPDSEHVLRTAAYIQVDRQNWAEARQFFEQALSLDPPGKPEESGAFLDLLTKTGHVDEALRSIERFRLADPLHPDVSMYLGHLYLSKGRIDQALEELERGYALDGFRAPISVEGMVAALASGDRDKTMLWLERAVENQQPGAKGVHTAMLDRFGNRDEALSWLRHAFDTHAIPDYYSITWGSYYGDYDLAIRAMQRTPDLWAFWTPLTAPVRSTEEFKDIVRSIGLVDYWRTYGWNDYCQPRGHFDFECG